MKIFLLIALLTLMTGVELLAAPQAEKLPPEVDLRPRFEQWQLSIRRQGNRGTCSVFTVTGALEYALSARLKHSTRLSVEFLNWAKNRAAHQQQDGGFFNLIWNGYEEFGVCADQYLPYAAAYDPALQPSTNAMKSAADLRRPEVQWHWIKLWDVKTGLTGAQLLEIKEALASGWPVCGGFRWPKKAAYTSEVLNLCPPEEVFDGHSVLISGYRDDPKQPGGGVFLFRDSSAGRYAWMPYAYAAAYLNDAGWVE